MNNNLKSQGPRPGLGSYGYASLMQPFAVFLLCLLNIELRRKRTQKFLHHANNIKHSFLQPWNWMKKVK